MIKRELFYFAECDGCDAPLETDNYFIFHHAKKVDIIEELENAEWVKKGREWFCLECQDKGVA